MGETEGTRNIVIIQKDGSVKIPEYIQKKLNIKPGTNLVFFPNKDGSLTVQKEEDVYITTKIPMEWYDQALEYIQKKNLNITIDQFFEDAVKKHLEKINDQE